MNKYPFHDSGIVDEGLSDETGSIEEEQHNNQENQLGNSKEKLSFFCSNTFLLFKDDGDKPKKPSQSYLEIIAEAILKSPNRMMQLYEIYHYFQRKYVINYFTPRSFIFKQSSNLGIDILLKM